MSHARAGVAALRTGPAAWARRCAWLAPLALALAASGAPSPQMHEDPIALGTNQRFVHLGLEEGLAQSTVYGMLQDRQGYIWMGTQAGLHRYDGYGFKIYRHDSTDPNSISDSQVFALYQARDGSIWAGTLDGLNRFDPIADSFTRYLHGDAADTISNDQVNVVLEDRAGRVWVGTGEGLNRLDPTTGKFQRYLAAPKGTATGLRHNIIWTLFEDGAGDIWIGTDKGVSIYRTKADRIEPLALSSAAVPLDDKSINVIRGDAKGQIWVAAQSGLATFGADGRRIAEYPSAEKGGTLGTGRVRDILFSRTGDIWLAVYRSGLMQLDPATGRVTVFRHDPADRTSISEDQVTGLMEDRSGVLWIATDSTGANRYNPATRRFLHYRHRLGQPDSLLGNVVWSVLPAADGTLWVGQETGLTRIDRGRGRYTHYVKDDKKPGALRGEFVAALHQDSRGAIWIGTERGLHRIAREGAPIEHIKYKGTDADDERALNSDTVVIGDGATGLWIGTSAGLVHHDAVSGASQRFRHSDTDPTTINSDFVLALHRSRDGALWVGTESGAAVRLPGATAFERLPQGEDAAHRLPNPFVQTIVEDADGAIWIGTSEGLSRYDRTSKSFQHYGVEQGLPNETIYTLLRTDDGMLWMSTNRGIARFDPRSHAVRSWLVEDGLQSNEFNGGAAARAADGELFFGGVNGLNAFHPAALEERDVAPTVAITEIELLDSVLPVSGELARTRQLTMRHDQPSLTLHFAVFDYAAPLKNRFQFILEGFDPGWRDGRTRSSVTYTNLDPGVYTFRVKGANTHAVWSLEEASLQVVVLPPPWRTWWAYLAYLVLAFATVALIARAHHLRVKRDHELEAEQAKRRWSETLHQLAQSLSSSLDAHQIAELLLDSLRRMVTFRTAALFVEQGVDLQLVGTRGFPEEEAKQLRSLPEARARLFAECRHRREPMMLSAEDVRETPLAGDGPSQAHVLAIPTYSRSEEFSLLLLGRSESPFSAQEQEIAIAVVRQALVALDNARLFSELQNLATTDNLTKVNNRRYFFELAELEFARGRRYGRNLAVILLDADGFTQLNESHGHEIGDRVLRLIASTCRANLRHFDIIGRYGGEDFVVMLPETALNVAADVADRLRKAVESMVIETHSGELRVTVSLGVAIATPDVPDLATLINRADMALYEAKRSGRNRVVVSEQG